jgi:hypothetical protein
MMSLEAMMTKVSVDLTTPKPYYIRPKLIQHPMIPPNLAGVNPRNIKGQEWWDVVRKKAYEANNQCCWACGVHRSNAELHHWLEAHEIYKYDKRERTITYTGVCALCPYCHAFIHLGHTSKTKSVALRMAIVKHGVDILLSHNLKVPVMHAVAYMSLHSIELKREQILFEIPRIGSLSWRLIFEGKSYITCTKYKEVEDAS